MEQKNNKNTAFSFKNTKESVVTVGNKFVLY